MIPTKQKKAKMGVNVSITNKHHDYYSEEADSGLTMMLGWPNNKVKETEDASVASDKTVGMTITAVEIRNTMVVTRSNPPKIAPENVEIVNDDNGEKSGEGNEKGSDCDLTETPWSIQIQDNREIHNLMLVSICSNLRQQQQSPHNTPPLRRFIFIWNGKHINHRGRGSKNIQSKVVGKKGYSKHQKQIGRYARNLVPT